MGQAQLQLSIPHSSYSTYPVRPGTKRLTIETRFRIALNGQQILLVCVVSGFDVIRTPCRQLKCP